MAGSGYGASACNSILNGKYKNRRPLCTKLKTPYGLKNKELEKLGAVPEIIVVVPSIQVGAVS
jgi:hypothetical protein